MRILILIMLVVILIPTNIAFSDDCPPITSYNLYYGLNSIDTGTYDTEINVGLVTTYTVTSLSTSTYYFAVTAVSDLGESDYSNEVNTYVFTGQVTLSWDAPTTCTDGSPILIGPAVVTIGVGPTFKIGVGSAFTLN